MAKAEFKKSKPNYVLGKELPIGTLCEIMTSDHKGKLVITSYKESLTCLASGGTWDCCNTLQLRVLDPSEIVELSNE